MNIDSIISGSLSEARAELEQFISAPDTVSSISRAVTAISEALRAGGKVMACGNGGSLCDATHFAEELTGRFRSDRRPLPAMSCNDPAFLTCTANDFSYDDAFERWVEAFGRKGDVLVAISTSGSSRNVLMAADKARSLGMTVVALTSGAPLGGGEARPNPLSAAADIAVCAPRSRWSDRIQEIHIKVIHILVQAVEQVLGLSSD